MSEISKYTLHVKLVDAKKKLTALAIIFFLTLIYPVNGYTQCSSILSTVPSTLCLNQQGFISTSTSADSYEWDLCPGNLKQTPSVISAGNLSNFSTAVDIKTAYDGTNWYGFVLDLSNRLTRINFGGDLNNTPSFTELGNVAGMLSSPSGMDLVQEGSAWYILIANLNSSQLLLLDFGISLSNSPTVSVLYTGLAGSDPFSVVRLVHRPGGGHFVFVTEFSSRNITIISYANGFSQPPDASANINFSVANPLDIQVLESCGQWSAFVVGFNTKSIYRLDFGNSLFNTPTTTLLNGFSFYPYRIWSGREGDEFYSFISNSDSGGLYRLDMGKDLRNNTPIGTDLGNFSSLSISYTLTLQSINGHWSAFMVNGTNNPPLFRLSFPDNCGTINSFLSSASGVVSFNSPGSKTISVTTFTTGSTNSASYTINVQNLQTPDIDFSSTGQCVSTSVNFYSINQSQNLTSYSWNFGDGGSSSSSNPVYIYNSAGTFNVGLVVTDLNGCQNTAQKSIQIFNPPQANFSPPSVSPVCTGQNYVFTNTSTSDPGSNPNWQWSVNGTNVSTTQDLNYLFNTNSDQVVSLTASIPGCSTQSTQTVTAIQNGPLLSFSSPATSCVGASVSFTNNSSGSVLGYNWTFGDGNSSMQTSPVNSFASNGSYTITLSASNAAGCQNSFSKAITIYSNPQPDFSLDLPPFSCAGTPSQFNDLTPALTDSNLSSWSWQFGDAANGSSTLKNPAYTYASASNYNVTLQVASNFGCSGSVKKTITISPSPIAAFNNSAACVNLVTQFNDASTGNIKSRQWKIQNSTFNNTSPTYIFKTPATYPVTLTVSGNNNCISQISKNIVVPVPPVIDFTTLYPCTGSPAQFQEVNPGGSDPAVAWNWSFTSGSGSGNPVNYTFPSSGLYTVTLNSTRQSNCVYSVSKNISIIDGPVASFTPSVSAGAAPLNVAFSNSSTLADTYLWNFGDANNSTSTDLSPSFTFAQLGSYNVKLIASNAFNCSSTATALINVVIPNIDAALNSFVLANDPATSSKRAVVTIANKSNIPLVNPLVSVNLGGSASLKETIPVTIQVGGSLSRTLSMQIVPTQIDYVCAILEVPNDVFEGNNEQCVSLTNDEVVLPPYPNPATSHFTLEWINPSAQNVRVRIFKTNGQLSFDQSINAPEGLTQYEVDASSWANGLYVVQITGAASQKQYKLVIAN